MSYVRNPGFSPFNLYTPKGGARVKATGRRPPPARRPPITKPPVCRPGFYLGRGGCFPVTARPVTPTSMLPASKSPDPYGTMPPAIDQNHTLSTPTLSSGGGGGGSGGGGGDWSTDPDNPDAVSEPDVAPEEQSRASDELPATANKESSETMTPVEMTAVAKAKRAASSHKGLVIAGGLVLGWLLLRKRR